jgi:CubicO group peptidase (beta-lactamase class C family)
MPSASRLRFAALAGLISLALLPGVAAATLSLPRSTPEKQGVSSVRLLEFVEALNAVEGLHSLMVVRHGNVVAEGWWTPYSPTNRHQLYSLSKSFTSTAVGFAVAEGKIRVDDEVLKFFPEEAPESPGANLKAMRVRDLLSMSTGHQDEPPSAPDKISAKAFLSHPVPHKPGTHFKYNTPATFLLSALVQKQCGQPLLEYLRPRLFEPLGIENPTWDTNFQGVSLGGYGLYVKTEDIAKLGQLYLQKGRWGGRQLLPATWVEAATSRQVSNGSNPRSDWDQGYGYQFWRCRHGAYRGDGAFGQYCIVLPEQDAVVAITSGLGDMQGVLDRVWDKLLPAFSARKLPADRVAQERLVRALGALEIRKPSGSSNTPAPGMLGRTFDFAAGTGSLESVRVEASAEGWQVHRTFAGLESVLPVGSGRWIPSQGPLGSLPAGPSRAMPEGLLAASGAWTASDTLTVKICSRETPFHLTFSLRFGTDNVTLRSENNVGFSPGGAVVLTGNARGSPTHSR